MILKTDSRPTPQLVCDEAVLKYARQVLAENVDGAELDREIALSIGVDSHFRPIYVDIVGLGGPSECAISSQVVYRRAVERGATGLFFLHTHPSGNAEKSGADEIIELKLAAAGEVLGIKLFASLVIPIQRGPVQLKIQL